MSCKAYETLAECTVIGVRVQKLKSTRTGIVVYLAHVEGPLVNGYFCLATEAHDHDGLPHTLEHLVFMGSEEYPYKGVLDLLANRCLAQGTNAWTDVDHTCYTVSTAGSEGFLNLLPIYLEHVLYPTLTDAAFLTEVHHVTGEGEDAGVVYCEMQATENTGQDRTDFCLLQNMYPGRCGYKSETGGRLENLRNSCSNEKVRAYHRSFYRPDNLALIVVGQVEADQLFEALVPLEEKIISKGSLPPMERPWQSPVPSLEKSVCEEIQFPTDEEADGITRIAWRGPRAQDRHAYTAMGALLNYLTETSVAPLQRDLVEVENPYCCDVCPSVNEGTESCVKFTLTGVPTDKLATSKDKVLSILSGIASGVEALDMERIETVLKRRILEILNQVEETPHFFFAFSMIGDFLFSQTAEQFYEYINDIPYYHKLLEEPLSFWTKMITSYFVDAPHVAVLGSPSAELAVTMSTEEKERVARQRERLGEDGMRQKADKLEKSIEQNEITAPGDIVSSLKVPNTESIHFHPLVVMGNHQSEEQLKGVPEYSKLPVHSIPFFFQANHIHSVFIELTALLDTACLSHELKPYLPLFLELLFESPILRNGEVVPYETVVKELAADTVYTAASLGQHGCRFNPGKYPQAVFIGLKVELEKYDRGVRWLREVLFNVKFTKERLLVVATKMINDVARLKRKGELVVNVLHKSIVFTNESNSNLCSMVTQLQFLTSLVARLKDPSTSEGVIQSMASLRDTLTSPDNVRVVMSTNINTLTTPLTPWEEFLQQPHSKSSISPSSMPKVLPSQNFLSTGAEGKVLVVGVGGVESNFLLQSAPCVRSHDHPDFPAILVFISYLCALEGPMWRQVRGLGLSYHYNISCSPESGLLCFCLYKSSQLVQAYKVAKDILLSPLTIKCWENWDMGSRLIDLASGFVSGSTPFEPVQLEAAISSTIFLLIAKEKTVAHAIDQAILRYLQEVKDTHSRWLLQAVSKVTIDDLQQVGKEYFSRLFDPALTTTAVCCNPSKVTEVKSGLEQFNHTVETVEDLDKLAAI